MVSVLQSPPGCGEVPPGARKLLVRLREARAASRGVFHVRREVAWGVCPLPGSRPKALPSPLLLPGSRCAGRELRGGQERGWASGRPAGRPGRPWIRIRPADVGTGCRAPPGGRLYIASSLRSSVARCGCGASGRVPGGRRHCQTHPVRARALAPYPFSGDCTRRVVEGDRCHNSRSECGTARRGPSTRTEPVPLRPREPTGAAARERVPLARELALQCGEPRGGRPQAFRRRARLCASFSKSPSRDSDGRTGLGPPSSHRLCHHARRVDQMASGSGDHGVVLGGQDASVTGGSAPSTGALIFSSEISIFRHRISGRSPAIAVRG